MHSAATLTVKAPSARSSTEREDFAALVLAGGEVIAEGLEGRVNAAHVLLFLRDASCLVGIAALKKPNPTYRGSAFQKAGATQNHEEFPLELGWVFVLPSARGKGYAKALVRAAIAHAGNSKVFATSRTDNTHMHASLLVASFFKHGSVYTSSRGTHKLSLFLRGTSET